MPTSLSTPVVVPLPTWARKPRSSPLQRSSATPIAATGSSAGSDRATSHPTSGSRRPRWFFPCGPKASRMSRSCRPRWRKPRKSRPVARCSSSTSTSPSWSPVRAASAVMAVSQPKPAASGKSVVRAFCVSRRWPESGSRASYPETSRMSRRPAPFAIPKPPPCLRANAATVTSASPPRSGRRSPRRSASHSRRSPLTATRSPSVSAWPLPRRGSRITRAPAASAAAAVVSREPSSATITSTPGNWRRSSSIVVPIRASSSRAATRTVSGLSTPGRNRLDRRQDAVGRVADAVVAGRVEVGEHEQHRERADRRVDAVDGGEAVALEDGDGALLDPRRLDAHHGDACAPEALVDPGQEPGASPCLRLGRPQDDHAVHRLGEPSFPDLDDLALERVPKRCLVPGGELAAEVPAEVAELIVADVAAELRVPAHGGLDRFDAQRQHERPHPADAPVGILLDGTLDRADGRIDGTEREDRDPLSLEPPRGQCRVRALDEILRGLLPPLEVVGARLGRVDFLFEPGDLALEVVALGVVDEAAPRDPDADQDPDDEHQEDGRERRDVVAQVEHLPSLEPEDVPKRR